MVLMNPGIDDTEYFVLFVFRLLKDRNQDLIVAGENIPCKVDRKRIFDSELLNKVSHEILRIPGHVL